MRLFPSSFEAQYGKMNNSLIRQESYEVAKLTKAVTSIHWAFDQLFSS